MAELTIGVAFQIFTAVSAAVSLAISLSSMGQAGNFGQSDLGQSISRKGKDDPRIVPFGKSIIPAVRVFSNVNDQNQKFFTHVYSLGHGPLKSIQQVFVDSQSIFPVAGNDYSEQWHSGSALAQGFENLQIGVRRGTLVGSAWPQVIANSDGMWTTSHRGDGIASLSLLVERPDLKGKSDSPYRIMTDRITLTALCEGIAVIDPRTDPLMLGIKDKSKRTHTSFRNPIACLLTYLFDEEFGLRLDPSMVDLNSFISTMNWCDANQIYLDGYIDQGDTFATILNKFSSAFGGHIYLESGKLKVAPETSSPVLFNIKEEDLIGNISLTNNKGDYYNTIKIDFQNKNTDYDKDSFVLPKDATTDARIREDGRIFDRTLDCPLSTDPEYIKKIANRELKRALLCRKEVSLTVNNAQYNLKLNNVFTLTNVLYQLDTSTKWRVTKLETSLDEKVLETKVTAVQYDERIYDSTSYDDGNLSSSLPRPNFTVLPVTNLQFIQNNTLAVGSGTLNFESQYQGDARFRIQYKLSSSSVWTQYGEYPYENVNIVGLQTGVNYDFKVQCVASIGASAWTSIYNVRVNRSISLPAVTGLAANFTSPDCVITFIPISGAITNASVVGDNLTNLSQLVHYYEVSVKHGAAGSAKNYRTTAPQFIYPFDENSKRGLSRDLNITVRAISIYGDAGSIASITAANAPMAQPSGVKVDAQLKSLTVTWDNPSEPSLGILDYDSTDIYLVPTAQTVASDQYLIATSSHGSFTKLMPDSQKSGYIRIAHRDKFGHTTPITASPAYLYTQTTIDDLITGSEFNANFEKAEADILKAQQDIVTAKADIIKNANEITTTKSTVTAQGTKIDQVSTVANSNTGKIATLETSLSAAQADLNAKITTNSTAIANTNSAMTSMDTRLTAKGNDNAAKIATNATAITTNNNAFTSYKTSNDAEVAGVKSSVTTVSNAQATTAGKVSSMYGLRVDANGKVAGMTLNATNNSTSIDFLADSFRVASATTGTAVTAFEVRSGSVYVRNALIGSLTASQISADAINGNHIASNSRIVAGSGATSVTLDGSNPNWRIYAGSTTAASAPFRVSSAGAFVSTNATITGAITATSGNFNNVTYQNGNITGRLTVNGGFIDGSSGDDMFSLGNGAFRVDANGSLFANNGTFGGTIYADKISGDVTRTGIKSFPVISTPIRIEVNAEHTVVQANFPAAGFHQTWVIGNIPFTWTNAESGGSTGEVWVRLSNGTTKWIGSGYSGGVGTAYDFDFNLLRNLSIAIPAGVTWARVFIKSNHKQNFSRQVASESLWQCFKDGSGGISVTGP